MNTFLFETQGEGIKMYNVIVLMVWYDVKNMDTYYVAGVDRSRMKNGLF